MEQLRIDPIFPHDQGSLQAYDDLCTGSGIRRDAGAELVLAARDEKGKIVAAGSVLGKTLRCLVTSPEVRGEGVMARLVHALLEVQRDRGNHRVFVYSKAEYKELYQSLGFCLLAEIPGRTIMMENSPDAFQNYLAGLRQERLRIAHMRGWEDRLELADREGSSALVMNLNPMTLGHLELIKETAANSPLTEVFLLDEDASFFRPDERKAIFHEATAEIQGLILHGTDDYLISRASFPAYFLRDLNEAAEQQAELDARIFLSIAKELGIRTRVLGDEPYLALGRRYNQILYEVLTTHGLRVLVKKRYTDPEGLPYSASRVREALRVGDFEAARRMTPPAAHPYLSADYLGIRVDRLKAFVPEEER